MYKSDEDDSTSDFNSEDFTKIPPSTSLPISSVDLNRQRRSSSRARADEDIVEVGDIGNESVRPGRRGGSAKYADHRRTKRKTRDGFSSTRESRSGQRKKKRTRRSDKDDYNERYRESRDRFDQEREIDFRSTNENKRRSAEQKTHRKERSFQEESEIPITEILKKAQQSERAKYGEFETFPELTTDTIYVQGRNGFNAVKISGSGEKRSRKTRRKADSVASDESYPPVKIAVLTQKIWKSLGFVHQGFLGGMALLHFIMIQIFFTASMDFVLEYSVFSEIYANLFSLLIGLCIVSVFDKFDLARLDINHLRDIYTEYVTSAIAIPLYVASLCLHLASAKMDDYLALAHYQRSNESTWSNITEMEVFIDNLTTWQRLIVSKDLLVVLAWLFVSLGSRDDLLLIHLKSMQR